MLLGIDVGGTFTDAVVIGNGEIIGQAKTPTTHENLLEGILTAMDRVLTGLTMTAIERVAISTTIVTNALVQGKIDPVTLIVMPGPGMDSTGLLPTAPHIISGYVDHRGRQVAAPREAEVRDICRANGKAGIFAVSGKFSVRNPVGEQRVAEWIQSATDCLHITKGGEISGSLNFIRRTNSAYFNAAVWKAFREFAEAVRDAVARRGITAPVYILKADGGTMPLAAALSQPVETVFTGPAASVLGIMAMYHPARPAVSLDIGGTTTDIALWQNGVPLFADRGARIGRFPTAVRAFRLKSVGIGGDSAVRRDGRNYFVGPERLGPAMALGGAHPTLSDALIVLQRQSFGNIDAAEQAMRLLTDNGDVRETAAAIVSAAAETVWQAVRDMIAEQAAEPVYRVEDIMNSEAFIPEVVIGVGGAAAGLAPAVAERFHIECVIPPGAMVANAVGAAAARPTLDITLRADTGQNYIAVPEMGVREALPSRRYSMDEARQSAWQYLKARAATAGIAVPEIETIYEEEFNVVRGFSTTGKIMTVRQQIKPGVLMSVAGREVSL